MQDAEVTKSPLLAAIFYSWLHQPFRQPFARCVQRSMCYQVIVSLCKGREKKEHGKPCVTSVTIILFEKTFRQNSLSFKQIFL